MRLQKLHLGAFLGCLVMLAQSMGCEVMDSMEENTCDKICEIRLNTCDPGTTTEPLCVAECNKWSPTCQTNNLQCMKDAKTCEDTDWCFDEQLNKCNE